jgi:hypothetical protein
VEEARRHPKVWEAVLDQLALGEMPPAEKPQPADDQRQRLAGWTVGLLDELAAARAGDPGPVVLRRLSNAEYTATLRDLTGVPSLDPAKEFPADSAAGEGFMNVGQALVMSPALLTKYLDAAKDVARHAVLLPEGIGFSASTSPRDWAEERLTAIRAFYARFTDAGAGQAVNLQGIKFSTHDAGLIPLEKYFAATLEERAALEAGKTTTAAVATARGLNGKYFTTLWTALHDAQPSAILDALRVRWRAAGPGDAAQLAGFVLREQEGLWKFGTVGHIGKIGGPKAWQEPATPVLRFGPVHPEIEARLETPRAEFRALFPAALCYTKLVPVDEVVTLTLFFREDDQLRRLMLDDTQAAELDRLWAELHMISQDALKSVDVFEQLWQYATQDADPKVFEPLREPIRQRAEAFRKALVAAEPAQLAGVLTFAEGAYRRPLSAAEQDELRALYQKLRREDLDHDAALRLTLARVLVAPAFLYRAEKPVPGDQPGPVSDWELATRLSYFLWSSAPDAELRALAAAGKLHEPDVLAAQTRRMTADPRVRRLATEFACAWLHVYAFDELGEKSDRVFPTFASLRGAMYEETIRFFTDFFQSDRVVADLLNADYAFLNEDLAKHYGIPDVKGAEFRRVDGVQKFGRGGVLAQATTLAKQSGASRTSPILRGSWLCEVLLGEKLPRPPKDVPRLPEEEASETLTVRQLTEKHSTDPKCYACHRRIDAYGFALEAFDAIGRLRERDLGGRVIDTRAKVFDGTEITGLPGLRDYLLKVRGDAFLRQFSRKLVGYALGRSVQLSDNALLAEIRTQLTAREGHISAALETIVRSRQFREIRGQAAAFEE